MRILSLYVSSSFLSVGFTREQNGHWKSENSTTVTGAPAGPLAGLFASPTVTRGASSITLTSALARSSLM